jgi:hypothetical protein
LNREGKENDCVGRGRFIALERVMRKASLKAHFRLDKGNVSSNQEGPMSGMLWSSR